MRIYVGAIVKTPSKRIGTVKQIVEGYATVKHDAGWWAGPVKTLILSNQEDKH